MCYDTCHRIYKNSCVASPKPQPRWSCIHPMSAASPPMSFLAFAHPVPLPVIGVLPHQFSLCAKSARLPRKRPSAMATNSAVTPFDAGSLNLFIKSGPNGVVGDCPFSQKANLALQFRNVEYNVGLIDLSNKPEWFWNINEAGTTPVLLDGTHAIADSDEIVDHADTIGSKNVVLDRENDPNWDKAFDAVSPIFGCLVRFLKNKDEAEEGKVNQALSDALLSLNSFLESIDGPYLLGDEVCALDCNLAPKLKHASVAPRHYKAFEFPNECTAVLEYLDRFEQLDEWKATCCTNDVIVWGWSKFFK